MKTIAPLARAHYVVTAVSPDAPVSEHVHVDAVSTDEAKREARERLAQRKRDHWSLVRVDRAA